MDVRVPGEGQFTPAIPAPAGGRAETSWGSRDAGDAAGGSGGGDERDDAGDGRRIARGRRTVRSGVGADCWVRARSVDASREMRWKGGGRTVMRLVHEKLA